MYGYYREKLNDNHFWEWKSLLIEWTGKLNNKKKERGRGGGGKEEVHIQAGEALIIQNVCRY